MLRLYLHNHDPQNGTKDFSISDVPRICASAQQCDIQVDFDDAWRIDESILAMLKSSGVAIQINVVTSFSLFEHFPIDYFTTPEAEIIPRQKFFSFDDLARLQKAYSVKIGFHSCQHQRACEHTYRQLMEDYKRFKELCGFYMIKYENEIVLPYGRPPALTDCVSYKQSPVRLIGTEKNYRYWVHRLLFNMSTRIHVSKI